MSSTNITRPRATKKFKALIAAGLSETEAFNVLGVGDEAPTVESDPVADLVTAGFTEVQARKIIADRAAGEGKVKGKKKGKKAKAEAAPEPEVISPKQAAEALVAQQGMTFTRGRVYGGIELAKAIVRVSETGTPEIVASSGVGRTSAVLVYRETSGDVAQQNLMKPV